MESSGKQLAIVRCQAEEERVGTSWSSHLPIHSEGGYGLFEEGWEGTLIANGHWGQGEGCTLALQ